MDVAFKIHEMGLTQNNKSNTFCRIKMISIINIASPLEKYVHSDKSLPYWLVSTKSDILTEPLLKPNEHRIVR